MSSLLTALALGACLPQLFPTAEMIRSEHGKPDAYRISKCGGGTDEYGKRIAPWKCLIWSYADKGEIYFGQTSTIGQSPYVVTGCAFREPVITKHDGPVWFGNSCAKDGKETACKQLGLGVDETDDFRAYPDPDPMGGQDTDAVNEWMRSQAKFCTTRAEAQKAAKACAAPEKKRMRDLEPAADTDSDADAPTKLAAEAPARAESGTPGDNFQARIIQMQQVVARDPKNVEAWIQLGNDYFDTRQPQKAIEAYDRALELRPDNPNVLADQGVMYRDIGQFDKAIALFEKANQVDPKYVQSLFNIGVVYLNDLKQPQKAIAAWNKVIQIAPQSEQATQARDAIKEAKKVGRSDIDL